jgi:RNA polymerase sigma-70 factor (ECF subfamily)
MDSSFSFVYNRCVALDRKAGGNAKEAFALEAIDQINHLYRVAFHLAKGRQDAEDLVQETYARALKARSHFAPGTNMKAWLTKILYNFFFDHYQERKRWVFADSCGSGAASDLNYWDTVASPNPGPERSLLQNELKEKISQALRALPDEYRIPILLVDMGDLSYAETAEILSCPIGTIRSRISRGRRLMHEQLRGYLESKQ